MSTFDITQQLFFAALERNSDLHIQAQREENANASGRADLGTIIALSSVDDEIARLIKILDAATRSASATSSTSCWQKARWIWAAGGSGNDDNRQHRTRRQAMKRIIFKRVDEDGDEAVCVLNSAHRIERLRSWYRLGGEQWDFSCSCGWRGQVDGCGGGKTNAPAQEHAEQTQHDNGFFSKG